MLNKKALSEADICEKFISPALQHAGWDTSSSMKNVGRTVILNMPVPVPPLAEQHRIVTRVQQLRALCAQLRDRLQTARATQSRLAQALVDQAVA